jgi:hypothetical protein
MNQAFALGRPAVFAGLIVGAFATAGFGILLAIHPTSTKAAALNARPRLGGSLPGAASAPRQSEEPKTPRETIPRKKPKVKPPSAIATQDAPLGGSSLPNSPGTQSVGKVDCLANSGNCAGINNGQQIVNQYGDPPVKITASLDTPQPPPSPTGHPRASVKFYTDRNDNDGQFAVICDHACNAVSMCGLEGYNQGEWGKIPGQPDVAAFLFHRQFPAAHWCVLTVESEDDQPVKIIAVKTLTLTNQPPK